VLQPDGVPLTAGAAGQPPPVVGPLGVLDGDGEDAPVQADTRAVKAISALRSDQRRVGKAERIAVEGSRG
jgi:hypothetical protein